MREIEKRVAKLETKGPAAKDAFRLFFEPRSCADPAAFAKQCEIEASPARAFIVRFVALAGQPQGAVQ